MLSFDKLMTRVEETTIQAILGDDALSIVNATSEARGNLQYLKRLILDIYGESGILHNPQFRAELFDLLKPEEARELCGSIGIRKGTQGWPAHKFFEALKKKSIKHGSMAEKNMFSFFQVALPEIESSTSEIIEQVSARYSLFSHQRQAVRRVNAIINEEPYRVLLHMPTGAGKTRTAMNLIADHLRMTEPTLVIWLANSEELCSQAVEEFQAAWQALGNRNVGIFSLWGSRRLDLNDDRSNDGIVIASMAKLNSIISQGEIAYMGRLASRASLIIMDEAHQALAPTYQRVLDILCNLGSVSKLLGLSATPGRTWNDVDEDRRLAALFARKKVKLEIDGYSNPVDYLVAEGYLAKANFKKLIYQGAGKVDLAKDILDIPDHVLKMLGEDAVRNIKIVSAVEQLIARGHKRILLFAPTVACSNLLAIILRARGVNASSVTGETVLAERQNRINAYKEKTDDTRVLCNFGVLTTGFDAPKTSAAIIARPTFSLVLFSQMVGRAIRGIKAGGNEEAEIITVIDTNLPGFESVASAFENWEDVWE